MSQAVNVPSLMTEIVSDESPTLDASNVGDSSETISVIKLGTLTAWDMRMHHVFIILTFTFIQGHADLNHKKNKCSFISETFQAMHIKFN